MAFTWVYNPTQGDYVESEEVTEIRNNLSTLSSNILAQTPISPQTISFLQPLSDGITIQDEVMDEIQLNLNTLKSENYCRGYFSAHQITDNVEDHIVITSSCTGYAATGCISQHSSNLVSEHGTRYNTNNSTNKGTVHEAKFTILLDES